MTLLASAGTVKGITDSIIKFYAGTEFEIKPRENNENIFNVVRLSDNKLATGVIVRKKGQRYRFEMV